MKKNLVYMALVAAFGMVSAQAGSVNCAQLARSVKSTIAADQGKLLEVVSKEVAANSDCACEIVKVAIEVSNATPEVVGLIVETAITASPEQMRLISQCAVAVAPDSLAKVQAVVSKLDPGSGKAATSAKGGSKQPIGEVASAPNPLDFPGQGPIGPTLGSSGGQPLIPLFPPIVINPPVTTETNVIY